MKPHPARFPIQLPHFFIRFLTDSGDLVIDPFAGSNTTGEACEELGNNWIAIEHNVEYLEASRFRFEPHEKGQPDGSGIPAPTVAKPGKNVGSRKANKCCLNSGNAGLSASALLKGRIRRVSGQWNAK